MPRNAFMLCSLSLAIAGCGGSTNDGGTTPKQNPVASVSIAPDAPTLSVGGNVQLVATLRDAGGVALTGRTIAWASSDQSKATVSQTGTLTAGLPGTTTVTATSEGVAGTTVVTVTAPPSGVRDFSIVGAQFTQGIQDADGTIPMVLGGNAAVVNVLVKALIPGSTPMQFVLRLFDASGALVRADTAVTSAALGTSPTFTAPSVQFLVPASAIKAGLRWQVVRDPRGVVPDDVSSNDVFPQTGTQALATVAVPPLNIRFVPIVIAANGNSTPVITAADVPEYLRTLRSVHPLGQVDGHVGAAFTTSASFGTGTTGGAATFWQQLISELDVARLADPTESTINWYGVVSPPPEFNFTTFGGFSYLPPNGAATGPHTRTGSGVRLKWFSKPTQARDLVAHELGHSFGRSHSPCGGAPAPTDPAYPVGTGGLDFPGHDVFSWATGLASSAATVDASTGDVMGYCFPLWSSSYTYKAVLAFRQTGVVASIEPVAERTRVLMIRGAVERGRSIVLAPSFTLDARPALPDAPGAYRADGLTADGLVLFSYSFDPANIDHAPDTRHFTLAIPMTDDLERQLDRVRVIGPEGEVRTPDRRGVTRVSAATAARAVASREVTGNSVGVSCLDDGARGILVIDAESGSVVGMSPSATMHAGLLSGRRMTVLCSDGLSTRRTTITVP